MYAVIRAGGKQHKVAEGDIIEVEKVSGDSVEFTPLLIVDDKGKVRSGASDLGKAKVTAKVLEETKGPKIKVFKYKNKTGYRRTTGHRQKYSKIEISGIKLSGGSSKKATTEEVADGS
ncbi:MAG: 50S ribosomal protein L21 [Actinomycetota bacterium]